MVTGWEHAMRFFTCKYRSFILASAKPEPQVVRIYERVSIHTYTHIQLFVVGVRGVEKKWSSTAQTLEAVIA